MNHQLHIAIVSYYKNIAFSTCEMHIDNYSTLTGWAENLADKNVKVSVFLRFKENATVIRNGVTYYFAADNYNTILFPWQVTSKMHCLIKSIKPSLIHIDNLNSIIQACGLKRFLPPECKIVLQHHGERPRRKTKWLIPFLFKYINGFIFAAPGCERTWSISSKKIHYIMEGSTNLRKVDKSYARAQTKMTGDPIFLWVGRLNANKDPLTVLEGFSLVLKRLANARLYMIFGTDDLLEEIKCKIDKNTLLKQAVILLGRIAHNKIENYYNSADYFISGSHYEGSGYALAEALACGITPIVTDIPSFRMMTDNGTLGKLWKAGSPVSLSNAIFSLAFNNNKDQSDQIRYFFDSNLSFAAIADKAIIVYNTILKTR